MDITLHIVHRISKYEVSNTGIGRSEEEAIADFRRKFAETYLRPDDSASYVQETNERMETIAQDLIDSGGHTGDEDGNYIYHLERVTMPGYKSRPPYEVLP